MPTSRSTPRPRTAEAPPGLTLLELIVVMAILATLFGLGVGAFRGAVPVERLAAQQVADGLRAARLLALAEGAPARLVVSPAAGTVRPVGWRRVGNWHFEDEDGAGWPVPATHDADALVEDGPLGRALRLGAGSALSIAAPPASFDGEGGFLVELLLQPEPEGRPMTILERAGAFRLYLDGDDELAVSLLLEGGPAGERLESGPTGVRLDAGAPQRLSLGWDGQRLRVVLDGLPVLERTLLAAPRRLAVARGVALHTGSPPHAYRGLLDELSFAMLVEGEARPLPDGVRLAGDERAVHLDASGRLDLRHHAEAADVALVHGDPPQETLVRMEPLGTVRTLPPAPAAGAAPVTTGAAPGGPTDAPPPAAPGAAEERP